MSFFSFLSLNIFLKSYPMVDGNWAHNGLTEILNLQSNIDLVLQVT